MGRNLRSRLQQIRLAKKVEPGIDPASAERAEGSRPDDKRCSPPVSLSLADSTAAILSRLNSEQGIKHSSGWGFKQNPEWGFAGSQVLKRRVNVELPISVRAFPESLAIIIPDLYRYGIIPNPEDLVFFDLETTGLSGGAGTLAFLGSFGRLEGKGRLAIEQYLLLDYPGESGFLEALKAELVRPGPGERPPLVVSYNGKAFDSQIFRNRCLMNGIVPPDYFHADLLYPSRRLWKSVLPNCSQITIETLILGLDRTGDIPGAMAPEIWFSFLKSAEVSRLLGICDHNILDIRGLASIVLLLGNIAAAPLKTLVTFKFDLEALALLWRETLLCRRGFSDRTTAKWYSYEEEKEKADVLLEAAAELQMPKALYFYGLELLKTKNKENKEKGRNYLISLANSIPAAHINLKAAAYSALAKEAEWQQRDLQAALAYTEPALSLAGIGKNLKEEFERRRERLLAKLAV